MLDSPLRPAPDRASAHVTRRRVDPIVISATVMVLSTWAAVAAWRGAPVLAVGLWLVGRAIGVLTVGRRSPVDDLGRSAAAVFEAVGIVAIPIGIAAGIGETSAWVATAVLLATLHLDVVSRARRGALRSAHEDGDPDSRSTIERYGTIVLFSLALLFPGAAVAVFWMMAAAIVVLVGERLYLATGVLP